MRLRKYTQDGLIADAYRLSKVMTKDDRVVISTLVESLVNLASFEKSDLALSKVMKEELPCIINDLESCLLSTVVGLSNQKGLEITMFKSE